MLSLTSNETIVFCEVSYAGCKAVVQMDRHAFEEAQADDHRRVWVHFEDDQTNPLPIKAHSLDFIREYTEDVSCLFDTAV